MFKGILHSGINLTTELIEIPYPTVFNPQLIHRIAGKVHIEPVTIKLDYYVELGKVIDIDVGDIILRRCFVTYYEDVEQLLAVVQISWMEVK